MYCHILPQQDLNETGNYYFTKKPPFQTCNSYELSCDLSAKHIQKKGVGLRNPKRKLPLATKGVLPPCYQHPLREPAQSLAVLAPGGYFVHKQVQPHPKFSMQPAMWVPRPPLTSIA